MEILQLKYFMEAAKKENITHAAKVFLVPPSSVSVAIRKLENELGTPLFSRTANTLKLNECGKIFLNALLSSEKEIKKAKTQILNLSSSPSGEIKLLILTNRRMITDTISGFKKGYPNVSFNIRHDDYSDYADYNKYDIIISDRFIDSSSFRQKLFIREEIFIGVSKTHPLADRNSVSLKALSNEKFIAMPKGSSLRQYMEKNFKEVNIKPEIVIECDDPYYICEYLKMELGITFFPGVSWEKQIDESIRLLKINDGMYRDSYIYINKESNHAAEILYENLVFNY